MTNVANEATRTALAYLSGFGNEHASEAVPGALPVGRNSPQRPPYGLVAEQLSGTAFTAPRSENLRSWLYRIRPSADHAPFLPARHDSFNNNFKAARVTPNRLRWDPQPIPEESTDFLDGIATLALNGNLHEQRGMAAHLYACNSSMVRRYFSDSDGELLVVPQLGGLRFLTEFGILEIEPGEIAVIPRGVRFRVDLLAASARGYICENLGVPFRLPELGPIGSNGLANPRDFLTPVAAFEDREESADVLVKIGGSLWSTMYTHSPCDVVAWHGNYAPYKYDLRRFNTIQTVSFDHPDPSIFSVLTSPSERPGTANADFVIFPPRWLVAEDTFRPPWFHRNVMSELMGLVAGEYDAKAEGFAPGGMSLHNALAAHGPDLTTFESASADRLQPRYLDNTLAFMFESRYAFAPTSWALHRPQLQADYDAVWRGFPRGFSRHALEEN